MLDKDIAQSIKNTLKQMKEIGAVDDYRSLSVAAKMHHILKCKQCGQTGPGIKYHKTSGARCNTFASASKFHKQRV